MITRISAVRPRDRVTVTGAVRSAAAEVIGTSPAFRCVLTDGSGEIDLLFLGQSAVTGLAAGRRCTVRGRACAYRERLVIWNPRYELEVAAARPLVYGAEVMVPARAVIMNGKGLR